MKRNRILVGLLVVLIALIVGGFVVTRSVRNFFYSPAPPMPALVNKTVPQILDELTAVMKSKAPRVLEEMQAGLSDEEIMTLEQKAGIQLPEDIRALYRWHNGCQSRDPRIVGPVPGHRFVPLEEALGLPTVLSNEVAKATTVQQDAYHTFAGHRSSWISLFDDGAGDGYFFDPKRKPEEGAVFFCFNETGTYVYFPSVGNLLAGVLKCYETGTFFWKEDPSGSSLDEDFEKAGKIWDEFGASNGR